MKCELKGLLPISVDLFVPNSSESNHQHHFRFTFRQVKRVSDHFCNPFWQSFCTSQCLARHGLILKMLLTLNCLVNVIGWGPAWLANRSWRIKDSALPVCFCYTNLSNCWELWSSTHPTSQCCDCFRANIPFRLRFWPTANSRVASYAKANLRQQSWEACEISQVSSMGQTNLGCCCVPWLIPNRPEDSLPLPKRNHFQSLTQGV